MPNPRFQNHYLELPADFYHHITPEKAENGKLIHSNSALLSKLKLQLNPDELCEMTCGRSFPTGLTPIAQKYTGHQFGYYNPDLGDGRGLLLGQYFDDKNQSWDLHLKGSGRTPFSRRGDGRAVLRSAIREYLIGEALHALGIPTSRCLSIFHSNEQVRRESFEDRATYIRVAKTHVRFGHFEWLAQQGDREGFQQLADYVIEHVYPHLQDLQGQNRYATLLKTIMQKTAELIAAWQSVGFCHGVMNSDNMSVAGETFDFGPYAFLDDCQVHYICNHSDSEGRYAYSQQPSIGLWNCQVLGQAFLTLVSQEDVDAAVEHYIETFNQQYLQRMANKFGLQTPDQNDRHFIADTLLLMDQSQLDFHHFFIQLQRFDSERHDEFEASLPDSQAWRNWQTQYRQRVAETAFEARQRLIAANAPQLVLRNYIAEEIIQSAQQGDYQPLEQWMLWLQTPFHPDAIFQRSSHSHYLLPPKAHQKGIALSCSS